MVLARPCVGRRNNAPHILAWLLKWQPARRSASAARLLTKGPLRLSQDPILSELCRRTHQAGCGDASGPFVGRPRSLRPPRHPLGDRVSRYPRLGRRPGSCLRYRQFVHIHQEINRSRSTRHRPTRSERYVPRPELLHGSERRLTAGVCRRPQQVWDLDAAQGAVDKRSGSPAGCDTHYVSEFGPGHP